MSMAREKLPPQQAEKLTAPRHTLNPSKPPTVRTQSSSSITSNQILLFIEEQIVHTSGQSHYVQLNVDVTIKAVYS